MIVEKFLKLLDAYEQELLKSMKKELIGAKVTVKNGEVHNPIISKYNDYQIKFMEINTVKNYFKTFKEEDHKMFSDFIILSEILLSMGLSNRERAQIMIEALRKNTYSGILGVENLDNAFVLDANKIVFIDFETISREKIKEMYLEGSIVDFINMDLDEASLEELEQINELLERKDEYTLDISKLYNATLIVDELLNKKDGILTDDEINKILNILIDFRVDKEIVDAVNMYLINKRNKSVIREEKNKKQEETSKQVSIKREVKQSNLVTDKEYKSIKKEIYKYYNLYTQEIVSDIDIDTMIRIASLMFRIDIHKDEIYTFIRKVKENILLTGNPVSIFVSEYDRLKFYYTDEELSDIKEYLKEIFICDNDDYLFWLDEINNELNKLLRPIENNYNYELDIAKKRLVG